MASPASTECRVSFGCAARSCVCDRHAACLPAVRWRSPNVPAETALAGSTCHHTTDARSLPIRRRRETDRSIAVKSLVNEVGEELPRWVGPVHLSWGCFCLIVTLPLRALVSGISRSPRGPGRAGSRRRRRVRPPPARRGPARRAAASRRRSRCRPRPGAAAPSSRSSPRATTESWCSPSSSWTALTRLTSRFAGRPSAGSATSAA